MRALNRKLLRDLLKIRGQVVAIGLVIASGVGVLVMALSVLDSLQVTADAYYERYNFGEVFGGVKRAPERLAERIADIPGVQTVQTRISRLAILDVAGFEEPVIGKLTSIPERGEPLLNKLALRQGRFVQPGRPDEVVLNEPFAEAHNLQPGDTLRALMNGKQRRLTIVGIALSPEYVYAIGPGSLLPDDKRFGVLWMGREALAAAYDLDGAFNDVSLTLLRGAAPEPVIERLDALLERYGGIGAIARKDQLSNWFLMNELAQIATMARIMPTIFLAGRRLSRQHGAGAADLDRAYRDRPDESLRLHRLRKSCGTTANWSSRWRASASCWAGSSARCSGASRPNSIPTCIASRCSSISRARAVFALGTVISLGAALGGTLSVVRRAATLPPAEAMRPPEPPVFRRATGLGQKLTGWLDQPTRIVTAPHRTHTDPLRADQPRGRHVAGRRHHGHAVARFDRPPRARVFPGRPAAGSHGRPGGTAVERRHCMNSKSCPACWPPRVSALSAPICVPVRGWHRGTVQGVRPTDELQVVYDVSGEVIRVPAEGLVMSTKLAEKLQVDVGDMRDIEVLEGRRPTLSRARGAPLRNLHRHAGLHGSRYAEPAHAGAPYPRIRQPADR